MGLKGVFYGSCDCREQSSFKETRFHLVKSRRRRRQVKEQRFYLVETKETKGRLGRLGGGGHILILSL